jgi:hypothetical protein
MTKKVAFSDKNNPSGKRPVDFLADEVVPWWKKTFVYVRKKQVVTWKGTMILMFFAGSAVALVWSAKTNNYSSSNAAAASTLSFNPATATVTNGASFTLTPTINTGANHVSIVALRITFDQTKLALDSITPSATFGTIEAAAAISNTNGTATEDLSVGNANPSVNGTFAVATLNFHAIATGSASVAFTGAAGTSGAAADGETGNVVIGTTPATVTVNVDLSDTAPAILSGGAPSGTLSSGTTTATLAVTTNENATCKFGTVSGAAYDSIANTFTTTGGTSHSYSLSGLTKGTTYNYYVRCLDTNNNPNVSDYTITFKVASSSSSHHKKKSSSRKISNSPKSVARGQILIQSGKKFTKNANVALYFSRANGTYYPPKIVRTNSAGSFSVACRIIKPAGTYKWYAVNLKTGWKSKTITYKIK